MSSRSRHSTKFALRLGVAFVLLSAVGCGQPDTTGQTTDSSALVPTGIWRVSEWMGIDGDQAERFKSLEFEFHEDGPITSADFLGAGVSAARTASPFPNDTSPTWRVAEFGALGEGWIVLRGFNKFSILLEVVIETGELPDGLPKPTTPQDPYIRWYFELRPDWAQEPWQPFPGR